MNGWTVSQLAARAGVPASTLRFYERQGLVTGRRSPSGYRLFDDDAVEQLRFIATAKGLGLSLQEVRALLAPWRREGCREVQQALAPMLEERGAQARGQIAALQGFAARLDQARALLDGIDRDGPCDASCAFLDHSKLPAGPVGAAGAAGAVGVALAPPTRGEPQAGAGEERREQVGEWAQGCSLPASTWPERVSRWVRVLAYATTRTRTAGGVRVEFDAGVLDDDPGELLELVRAEQDCCASLQMVLRVGVDGVVVEARTPDAATEQIAKTLFAPLTPP